ncbi:MAG: hypothetical protein R2771_00745 [Saprospiraceae bacterium]
MIRSIILSAVFVSFLLPRTLFSQAVVLQSQADVDAFDPATTTINGNLNINGYQSSDPITNLSNLSNLTSISLFIYMISNVALTNIDGLSNLSTISGGLKINNNAALSNLMDLQI